MTRTGVSSIDEHEYPAPAAHVQARAAQLGMDLQPKSAETFALLSACTVDQDAGQRMIFVGALLLS